MLFLHKHEYLSTFLACKSAPSQVTKNQKLNVSSQKLIIPIFLHIPETHIIFCPFPSTETSSLSLLLSYKFNLGASIIIKSLSLVESFVREMFDGSICYSDPYGRERNANGPAGCFLHPLLHPKWPKLLTPKFVECLWPKENKTNSRRRVVNLSGNER
jgi:hypothetical protein